MNNRLKIPLKDKELDKIIIELAKQGHCSKRDLAEHLGVPQSNVSIWLREKFIPAKHFRSLHEYLELPVPFKKID